MGVFHSLVVAGLLLPAGPRAVAAAAAADTSLVSPASPDSAAPAPPDSTTPVPPDTAAARAVRIVREFPVIEVRALLHDLRSSETAHEIAPAALRGYPVDGLADLVALQPGVVAQAGELHVRGGRAGETLVILDGLTLNEPLRHRPMEVPLLALESAKLVSGAPESRYAGALAGVLDLHAVDPGERIEGEARWQTDGRMNTHFDRIGARVSGPLPVLGLGGVLAGDVTLDDTWLPSLHSNGRRRILGVNVGWRAENRVLGYLKLAPREQPRRFSAQVLASRAVHEPYDPAWTLDGWTGFDGFGFPIFSPIELPGLERYRAADHLAITDDRRLAVLLSGSATRGTRRGTLALGWLRARTATTVGGGTVIPVDPQPALYRPGEPFLVVGGDYPLYRVSGSDVLSLRGDVESPVERGVVRFGAGVSVEDVRLDELDATLQDRPGIPIDSVRSYRATAPGAFAYAQGRWQLGGLVANLGLRAEYFTAGPEAERQTLPGDARGHVALLPRLGIAYPISSRDVFSMAYTRVDQTPGRDLLYDRRRRVSNRQPLGNPALRAATMISYEAALKHLFSATWALQASFFYRDVAQLAGARDYRVPGGTVDPRYTDEDQASSAGFELSAIHAPVDDRRLEVHYTFMHAWGYESQPEGDPYGPILAPRAPPFSELPLSWDRRHAVVVAGLWSGRRWTLTGSGELGSPLPWTPKPRREPVADLTTVNSRRLQWSLIANLGATWAPPYALGLVFGLEVRNLFDDRSERAVTTDGYPNPLINTVYDDYSAYRTETGLGGGAYWSGSEWVPVHDARLVEPPRTVRASVGRRW